jgi:hypothetical protein
MENYIVKQLTCEHVGRSKGGFVSITRDAYINEKGQCILYVDYDTLKFNTVLEFVQTICMQYNQVYNDIIFILQQKQICALQSNIDILNSALTDHKKLLYDMKTLLTRQNDMLHEKTNALQSSTHSTTRFEQFEIE